MYDDCTAHSIPAGPGQHSGPRRTGADLPGAPSATADGPYSVAPCTRSSPRPPAQLRGPPPSRHSGPPRPPPASRWWTSRPPASAARTASSRRASTSWTRRARSPTTGTPWSTPSATPARSGSTASPATSWPTPPPSRRSPASSPNGCAAGSWSPTTRSSTGT